MHPFRAPESCLKVAAMEGCESEWGWWEGLVGTKGGVGEGVGVGITFNGKV